MGAATVRAFRFALVLLALLAGCKTAGSEPSAPPERFVLHVLGRAQDGGLPHVGCDAPCCAWARETGRREDPACLGIHDTATGRLLLVEATPAIERQLALLHRLTGSAPRGRRPVDAVLLTHAHIGHYLGLAHFGREVAATTDLPVHVSARFAGFLGAHGPWSQLVALGQIRLEVFRPGVAFEPLPGLRVEAVTVPHRDEFSDTVAFRILGPTRTVLFVPDVDRWEAHAGLLERLFEGVDVAYVDGTFYDGRELPGRDLAEIPHPPITATMDRLAERARQRPGSVRFLHLNHTNPALHDARVRAAIEARGFAVAAVGERVGL